MEQEGRQSPDPARDEDERRARGLLDVLQRELAGEETVVAGRYVLGERIGVGAHGSVHAAVDRLTGERVAVKLLPPAVDLDLVRLRGEIAALRLLRLPGVVHLFDEGVDHGRPFLVMERVDGLPFPGALPEGETRWTWETLRGPTLALLDTLARVHAAGLVHRDLKPRNVLVTAAGRPMLLDFGLSVGRALSEDSASDTSALGTPAYAAPEQVRGEPVDARADLYSLGVMVWEALAGRRPHEAERVSGILRARLQGPAASLASAAPGAPDDVAAIVDALLEVERDARPRSALEVEERLRGMAEREQGWRLPLVGRDAEVARLVELAGAGRSCCIVGCPGSGRTRLIQEAAARLGTAGRRVSWAQPADRPFESLSLLAGWLSPREPASASEAHAATADALKRALTDGLVLVADDFDTLDPWSQRALLEQVHGGSLILSATEAVADGIIADDRVALGPLGEEEMRLLFVGNDRLLHVHEDAARQLSERTDRLPGSVDDELFAWWSAGLVEQDPCGLRIARSAIDRIHGGLPLLPRRTVAIPSRPLDDDLDELLAWCHLSWPNTSRRLLAFGTGRADWLVDVELEELSRRGGVRLLDDGRVRPLRASRRLAEQAWLAEKRERAHALLAERIEPGTTGRLYHLLAAGRQVEAAAEARQVASDHRDAGRLSEAEAALVEGLRAAQRVPDPTAESLELSIFADWLGVAISAITSACSDRLLYEMSRSPRRGRRLLQLERLARAAVAAYGSDGARSLTVVDQVEPFPDIELETWRHALRLRTARRCEIAVHEEAMRQARAWAGSIDDDRVRASLHEWEGLLLYRQGRYREAADAHILAARTARRPTARLSALLNAASALLELPSLGECGTIALEARDFARECRHALFEGRAAWLMRAAAYRSGEQLMPDVELVDALEGIGMLEQAALAALNEASIAFRRGDHEIARQLAEHAARDWIGLGKSDGVLLARALGAAAGGHVEDAAGLRLKALRAGLPIPAAQALALLAPRNPVPDPGVASVVRHAALRGKDYGWETRFEVLSLSEIVAACGLRRADLEDESLR